MTADSIDPQVCMEAISGCVERHMNGDDVAASDLSLPVNDLARFCTEKLSDDPVADDDTFKMEWLEAIIQGASLVGMLTQSEELQLEYATIAVDWAQRAFMDVDLGYGDLLAHALEFRADLHIASGERHLGLIDRGRALAARYTHFGSGGDLEVVQKLAHSLVERVEGLALPADADESEMAEFAGIFESHLSDIFDALRICDGIKEERSVREEELDEDEVVALGMLRSNALFKGVVCLSQMGHHELADEWLGKLKADLVKFDPVRHEWAAQSLGGVRDIKDDADWWTQVEECRKARMAMVGDDIDCFPLNVQLVPHLEEHRATDLDELEDLSVDDSMTIVTESIHQLLVHTPVGTLRAMECFCELCLSTLGPGFDNIRITPETMPIWLTSHGLVPGEVPISIAVHPTDRALMIDATRQVEPDDDDTDYESDDWLSVTAPALEEAGFELTLPNWSAFDARVSTLGGLESIEFRRMHMGDYERQLIHNWLLAVHEQAVASDVIIPGSLAIQLDWANDETLSTIMEGLGFDFPQAPPFVLGCPGFLLGLFMSGSSPPPEPGSHLWNLAVEHAAGCYIFKIIEKDSTYRKVEPGMIGTLYHFDPYDLSSPHLEWGINFGLMDPALEPDPDAVNPTAPWVPIGCLEPASFEELSLLVPEDDDELAEL